MTAYGRFLLDTCTQRLPQFLIDRRRTAHAAHRHFFFEILRLGLHGGRDYTFSLRDLSIFAASPPVIDTAAAPVAMVWSYLGELIFNMLILVGTIKMADHVVKEMMGL